MVDNETPEVAPPLTPRGNNQKKRKTDSEPPTLHVTIKELKCDKGSSKATLHDFFKTNQISAKLRESSKRVIKKKQAAPRLVVPCRELRPVERMVMDRGVRRTEEELHFLSCVQLCWELGRN